MLEAKNFEYPSPLSYTVDEAAIATGLSRTRLFESIRDKKLTARKDGRSTIILAPDLAAYLKALPIIGKHPEHAEQRV